MKRILIRHKEGITRILPSQSDFFMMVLVLLLSMPLFPAWSNEYEDYAVDIEITTKVLNVRSGPSSKYSSIGQVRSGEIFRTDKMAPDEEEMKTDEDGGDVSVWYRITDASGNQGWIHGDYVREILTGEPLLKAVQKGHLDPYTAEDDYSVEEAFGRFFKRPTWKLSPQENRVMFTGDALLGNQPTRYVIVFGNEKGQIVIDFVYGNEKMLYSRLEDLYGGQDLVNLFESMARIQQGDYRKLKRGSYHNTLDLNNFLASIFLHE